jgi:hypothetical protein
MIKKTLLFLIIINILLPIGVVFAQDLEIDYPTIPGPSVTPGTTDLPLEYYFEYIYYFATAIAGILALLTVVYAGLQYVTSAGNPDKLGEAKKRIFAALLGLLILALTYPILYNINPELINLEVPDLVDIEKTPLDAPGTKTITPRVLAKVEELAENIKTAAKTIDKLASDITTSMLQCNCIFSASLCWCTGGQDSDTCEPHQCYAGNDHHPCKDYKDIKKNMENIIEWKDELLFYRNWAAAEIEDLRYEVGLIFGEKGTIPTKIENYQRAIATETNTAVISYYQEQIGLLQQEIELKISLIGYLFSIGNNPDRNNDNNPTADLIKRVSPEIVKLPPLLEKCVEDEEGKYGLEVTCKADCLPSPSIGPNKGACHDTLTGCQGAPYCLPKEGGIGNPCPYTEVSKLYAIITALDAGIASAASNILSTIDQIRTLKSFTSY